MDARFPATRAFADWGATLRYDDIPAPVVRHAKICIIDAVGCGLYGASQPWGRIAARFAASHSGPGSSSLWGTAHTAGAADAALANGTAVHGFEIDDVHQLSLMHPGSVTLPAAWALAERKMGSGRDLICAVVAGYEIGLRIGTATGVDHMLGGFHPTGTVGALCAAAASAKMLQLDCARFLHTLAIGATQGAGLYCASKSGAMVKRLHAGRAAQSGVIAGLLAAEGFTGAVQALEDENGGFMATLARGQDLESLAADLGTTWYTNAVGFKAYAACASAHTIVDAFDGLMRDGLRPEAVEHATIRLSRIGMNNVGWPYAPSGIVAAQMNGQFTAAVKLLFGDAFVEQYTEETCIDPRILALIEKIDVLHDPNLDRGGAATRHATTVEVKIIGGGTVSRHVEQRRGSASWPLTEAEVLAKFERLAGNVLAADDAIRLRDELLGIDEVRDLSVAADFLRSGRRHDDPAPTMTDAQEVSLRPMTHCSTEGRSNE